MSFNVTVAYTVSPLKTLSFTGRVESDKDNPYMKIIDSTEKEDEVIEVIHVEDSLLPTRKVIKTKDKSLSISSESTRICRNEQVLRRNPPRRARPTFSSTDTDLGNYTFELVCTHFYNY